MQRQHALIVMQCRIIDERACGVTQFLR